MEMGMKIEGENGIILKDVVKCVMKCFKLKHKEALTYLISAISYNCVLSEIENQIQFLIEQGQKT